MSKMDANDTLIDTSKMSSGQRAALEMAEAAREAEFQKTSFLVDMFMGQWSPHKIAPFKTQSQDDKADGDVFLDKLKTLLRHQVDPDAIDLEGEIPDEVIEALGRMGAFGIKIDKKYQGLGLSQTNYCRAASILGGYCANLTALISAHQSIGVPQPLIMFGTEEQKKKYLPRFAKGEISAFALTEHGVGSDPAKMSTEATPTEDGEHFIINGEKLWCTNGLKASVIVVMAKTPPKIVKGRERKQVTAFIVDMDTPGVEIVTRCRFMGLRALYNGIIRFKDVKVPKENIILAEGKGLRVALSTLNTGRLTLPAACSGMAKQCVNYIRKWTNEREQWGAKIGKHAAIADKVSHMAANAFAMESMVLHTCSLVDQDKKADIRLEAAMAKMWGTEKAWEIIDETMQIRGGRGYETAQSLHERGEDPMPIERMMRDCRINMIFEGSSEIMRLFIMREALDKHLKIGAAVFNTRLPLSERIKAMIKSGLYYSLWYPKLWINFYAPVPSNIKGKLRKHLSYIGKTCKKMARELFHQMVFFGPTLERQQVLLGHFADIGSDLFAIGVTSSRVQALLEKEPGAKNMVDLADTFFEQAKRRIDHHFTCIHNNRYGKHYRFAQDVLKGQYPWFDEQII
ncbi:MAG: acyl-CoA dehydrogenase family protein [Verrucomicrobiota bacterium]